MENKSLKIFAFIIPVALIGILVYLFFNIQKKRQKVDALENIPAFSNNVRFKGLNTTGTLVLICQNDKFTFSFLQNTYLGLAQAITSTIR